MIPTKSKEFGQQKPRVAIIGGGMGGLALGYELSRDGWPVTLLEKGPQLSGLLAFTEINGVPIERYYHHFFTHDRYQIDLMHELGLGGQILWQESPTAVLFQNKLHPFVTKSDSARLPFLSVATKVQAAAGSLMLRARKAEDLPPDLTAEAYLRWLFGNRGWEQLWQPLLVHKFGDDAKRISAQWIAKRVQIRTGSSRGGREVLGYINGSYQVLANRLSEAMQEHGGRIVLNAEVHRLPKNADGSFEFHGQRFDIVVSTVAPDILKRIVPELNVPNVTYRSAICPLFLLESNPTPYYWMNNLDPEIPFSVIVNQQALLPKGYYRGQWPVYIGHYVAEDSPLFARSDGELMEYYLQYLERIFPDIRGQVIECQIGRAKHTQPVVTAPWTPLQHTTNIPGLYMTSMAHIFPEDRGVNYAIREARRVAALLRNDVGPASAVPKS